MIKITSLLLSKNNYLVSCFIILFTFFIIEYSFSENYWKRDFIYLDKLTEKGKSKVTGFWIRFNFFDFEFGNFKEHGYLERCDFQYTTDGENYITYARCEVKDQAYKNLIWIFMTNKQPNLNISFYGCRIPASYSKWEDLSNKWVAVKGFGTKASLTLLCYLPDDFSVKKIRVVGKWVVVGLYCPDYFTEIYDLPNALLKTAFETVTNNKVHKFQSSQGIDKLENGTPEVYSNLGAIVVKGAKQGETINIYTTTGALVKSTVADYEFVTFYLPAKQTYIVKVGQARYKQAL